MYMYVTLWCFLFVCLENLILLSAFQWLSLAIILSRRKTNLFVWSNLQVQYTILWIFIYHSLLRKLKVILKKKAVWSKDLTSLNIFKLVTLKRINIIWKRLSHQTLGSCFYWIFYCLLDPSCDHIFSKRRYLLFFRKWDNITLLKL